MAVIHKSQPLFKLSSGLSQRRVEQNCRSLLSQASTTDYSGVYRGHYIDFEAKETQQKIHANEEFPSSSDSTYGTVF